MWESFGTWLINNPDFVALAASPLFRAMLGKVRAHRASRIRQRSDDTPRPAEPTPVRGGVPADDQHEDITT